MRKGIFKEGELRRNKGRVLGEVRRNEARESRGV